MQSGKQRAWMALAIAAYAIFCISFLAVGILKPAWDWDVLAYVAETLEHQPGATPETIHRDTYEIVHATIPDEDWRILTSSNDYRVEQTNDANAFMSMLGMYRIKLGYELLMQALAKVMDPAIAALAISLTAGVILAIVIGIFLVRLGQPELLFLAIPVLVLAELPLLARGVSPDMLASLFFVSGVIAFLREKDWLASTLFILGVFVRPDYIVFSVLLPPSFLLLRRLPPLPYLVTLACSGVIYVTALKLAAYPGWWRHFVFAIIQLQPTMDGFNPPFSVLTYANGLARSIVKSLGWQTWPWAAGGAVFALLYFPPLREQLKGRVLVAFVALSATLMLKFLAFPIMDSRNYMPFVLGLVLIVADTLAHRRQSASEGRTISPGTAHLLASGT